MKDIGSDKTMAGLLLLNRLAVGWYFLAAGWGKVGMELSEGLGSFYAGDSFQGRNPEWLPALVPAPYGYALPWAELLLGVMLMMGLLGRVSAGLLTAISLSIAIALLGAGQLLPNHHIMVFLPITLMLAMLGSGRFSVDGWRSVRPTAQEPTAGATQP